MISWEEEEEQEDSQPAAQYSLISYEEEEQEEVNHTTNPQLPTDPTMSWEEEEEQEDPQTAAQYSLISYEEEEVDHTTNPQPATQPATQPAAQPATQPAAWPAAQHGPQGHTNVFFLYCKTSVDQGSLVDLADILSLYGISSFLDITTEAIPANWSIWTEEKIELCHYVILVCSKPLHKALKDNINASDNDLVDMFKGKFSARAVVNCIRAPKFIPAFIDCTPNENVVPLQLRTHHFPHLRVRELMQAVEGKPDEYVHRKINDNHSFLGIKQLIDLLQQ